MPIPAWQPGHLYQPGDIVRQTSTGVTEANAIDNPSFEDGDQDWTLSATNGTTTINQTAPVFDGTWRCSMFVNENSDNLALSDSLIPVSPGDVLEFAAYVQWIGGSDPRYTWLRLEIRWYTSGMVELAPTIAYPYGELASSGTTAYGVWAQRTISGVAPANAAFASIAFRATTDDSDDGSWAIDAVTVDFAVQEAPNPFIFRAVQASAGFSGNAEPEWPLTLGGTVVDNEVTWEAIYANSVTWEAQRILVSGYVEPTWPLFNGGSVLDNTIIWSLESRQVTDARAPQSEMALIASSKVFAPDGDIINYSATVNPLDWSTPDDAGYIPFGLQTYGANPVSAMGLYRGNVAAFNSQGCQIWQVNEDPAAITLLDAIPVQSTFPKSVQPVGDDLAFLCNLGIRSLGMAGSSVNLQGGYFGKQVDELVIPSIAEAAVEGWTPRGLYWPAQGQYWLFFGAQAYVLTINGPAKEQRSWSRYTFPSVIDAWTTLGTDLYLRSGDLIWKVDKDALCDDLHDIDPGVSFDFTVAYSGALAGFGYEFEAYGAANPDPASFDNGAQIASITAFPNGFEFFVITALLPTGKTLLRVESAAGTRYFNLLDPDDGYLDPAESWFWWDTDGAVWDTSDVGETYTVTFLDPDFQMDLDASSFYDTEGWEAAATSVDVGETQSYAAGTPVYLFGQSVTGLFADVTVSSGAAGANSIVVSDSVTTPDHNYAVLIRYPSAGTFELVDGNEEGSLTIELDAGLTSYITAGSILVCTHASGVEYHYLAGTVSSGATVLTLTEALENVITEVRVFPAGANLANSVDEDIRYVPILLADAVTATSTLPLTRPLPWSAVGLQAIVCAYQETFVISGGEGTSTIELATGTAFANELSAAQDEVFLASGSYDVPVGCTSIDVLTVGGGGATGGDEWFFDLPGGGGGGGGVVVTTGIAVTPEETLTVIVGAGGAASGPFPGSSSEVNRGFTTLADAGGGGIGTAGAPGVGGDGTIPGGSGGGGAYSAGIGPGCDGFAGGLGDTTLPAFPGYDGGGGDSNCCEFEPCDAIGAGGGGGAGGIGSDGVGVTGLGGNGGIGIIPDGDWGHGEAGYFGGGGGGYGSTTYGGDGAGNGAANTGGGATGVNQVGYSGIVIIRSTTAAVAPEAGFPIAGVAVGDNVYEQECTDFESIVQWPFLDLNNPGTDKELAGFDLSIDGECTISFGWDQRQTEFDVDNGWTVPYEIDGDTQPGMMQPFSLTGPSFAMRLVFPGGQQWKWYASQLYIKDLSQ